MRRTESLVSRAVRLLGGGLESAGDDTRHSERKLSQRRGDICSVPRIIDG